MSKFVAIGMSHQHKADNAYFFTFIVHLLLAVKNMQTSNYCVILCGGIGSRFWPVSRASRPKHFIDLLGVGRSMIQLTYDRLSKIFPVENIYVVAVQDYAALAEEQLPDLPQENFLYEPVPRKTAPCIARAALHLAARDKHARMLVAPADHLILHEENFLHSVSQAMKYCVEHETIISLGSQATRPDTTYGYIQRKDHVDTENFPNLYSTRTFVEKPIEEMAQAFVQSGEFCWNTAHFASRVDTVLEAFNAYLPEVMKILTESTEPFCTSGEQEYINRVYPMLPAVSIDYGVMEKVDNVLLYQGDFGWSNLASWDALHHALPKDEERNAKHGGQAMMFNSSNCMVAMPKNKLAVIDGLNNYIVAEKDDVLLICPKDDPALVHRYMTITQMDYGEKAD